MAISQQTRETQLQTGRLVLRPWHEDDAEDLFQYARDPAVGPAAGWPLHTSVEESRAVIRTVLSAPETYAVVLKATGKPVGSIDLKTGPQSNLDLPPGEGEVGYWIGAPFWGQGLIPEAVRELLRHGFEDLGLRSIWCCYYDGNLRSKRVQEKCGFRYRYTREDVPSRLTGERHTEHISCITLEEWKP
ncbi:MAG: GNAT family N-acetyltransferase [Bacteroidales bacterium]|nr:GNAT family N-acetyltransferase [Bacteroidales bacterium]